MHAHLVEVFSSVQGEGPELGTSTLFVRFAECDLRCAGAIRRTRGAAERAAGSSSSAAARRFEERDNPVPLDALVAACERLELARHRWLSLTGGEPLLQPEALRELARALRGRGPRIWLETHGLEAKALAQVLPLVDCVSMDWKLASDVRRASERSAGRSRPSTRRTRRSWRWRARPPRVVVKIVVTPASEDAEIDEALRRASRARTRARAWCSSPSRPSRG